MREYPSRHIATKDVRCEACGILLGRVGSEGLTVRRSQLQISIVGDFHASIVCYRPCCRHLNVLLFEKATRPWRNEESQVGLR